MDLLVISLVALVAVGAAAMAMPRSRGGGAESRLPAPIVRPLSTSDRARAVLTKPLATPRIFRGKNNPDEMTNTERASISSCGLEFRTERITREHGEIVVAVNIDNPPPPACCSFCGQMTRRVVTEYATSPGTGRVRLTNLPGDRCDDCSALAEEDVIFYNDQVGQIIESLVLAA